MKNWAVLKKDKHLAPKSSKHTQQTIIHLTMTGDDLGYRIPKTRLVLDRRPWYTKRSGKADQAAQSNR